MCVYVCVCVWIVGVWLPLGTDSRIGLCVKYGKEFNLMLESLSAIACQFCQLIIK